MLSDRVPAPLAQFLWGGAALSTCEREVDEVASSHLCLHYRSLHV